MLMAPAVFRKVMSPDWNGLSPKPTCNSSGSRKGTVAMPARITLPESTAMENVRLRNMRRSSTGFGCRAGVEAVAQEDRRRTHEQERLGDIIDRVAAEILDRELRDAEPARR